MIISSYYFSNDDSRYIDGQHGAATFRGVLRTTTDEPQAQVKWGPKVVVPSKTPFRIMHPAFKNTTYILEDIRFYGFKPQATFIECALRNTKYGTYI
tara:strand:- start:11824 stop:12114 length:291 start_codon:yes stop_codon:yes gene_type:complete